jgi:hypothetical protein
VGLPLRNQYWQIEADLTGLDSSHNVTQPVLELRKEFAPVRFESLANGGIVEVVRIAIEEATLRWIVKVQVRKHGCQHNGILT